MEESSVLAKIKPYVIGKGLTDPMDLCPGDKVYTLNENLKTSIESIDSVAVDFYTGRVNVVKSGQNQSLSTDSTRFMYVTGDKNYKTAFIKWKDIDQVTPNKEAIPSKYLPVLSFLDEHDRQHGDSELDGLARRIYLGELTEEQYRGIIKPMRGQDGIVLVTLMEEYFSHSPGKGRFGRASVKDRTFYLPQRQLLPEISRIAVLSGYTAQIIDTMTGAMQINFESTPVPGSIPKNQKYYKEPFVGYMYSINASNLPILGRSLTKWCFLPTTEG